MIAYIIGLLLSALLINIVGCTLYYDDKFTNKVKFSNIVWITAIFIGSIPVLNIIMSILGLFLVASTVKSPDTKQNYYRDYIYSNHWLFKQR